ncbi:oxidoreductase [Cupriavidus sp. CP313]
MREFPGSTTPFDPLSPLRLGPYELPNRVVTVPLTKCQDDEHDVPSDHTVAHYARCASAGLIITEPLHISPQGKGCIATPGLYSDEQVCQWQRVTNAVRAQGGRVFAQLWHAGGLSHRLLQPGQALPVAPSAIRCTGPVFVLGKSVPLEIPRALENNEIPLIIDQFSYSSCQAMKAGFKGVEICSANGCLLDQFLRNSTNRRADTYGGPVKNRVRLLIEVTLAVIDVWGRDRVGVRIGPLSSSAADDSELEQLFTYVARQLGQLRIAYLHVSNRSHRRRMEAEIDTRTRQLRMAFDGVYISSHLHAGTNGDLAMKPCQVDLISYGRNLVRNSAPIDRFCTGSLTELSESTTFRADTNKGHHAVEGAFY